jgi:hypothetical protein
VRVGKVGRNMEKWEDKFGGDFDYYRRERERQAVYEAELRRARSEQARLLSVYDAATTGSSMWVDFSTPAPRKQTAVEWLRGRVKEITDLAFADLPRA